MYSAVGSERASDTVFLLDARKGWGFFLSTGSSLNSPAVGILFKSDADKPSPFGVREYRIQAVVDVDGVELPFLKALYSPETDSVAGYIVEGGFALSSWEASTPVRGTVQNLLYNHFDSDEHAPHVNSLVDREFACYWVSTESGIEWIAQYNGTVTQQVIPS